MVTYPQALIDETMRLMDVHCFIFGVLFIISIINFSCVVFTRTNSKILTNILLLAENIMLLLSMILYAMYVVLISDAIGKTYHEYFGQIANIFLILVAVCSVFILCIFLIVFRKIVSLMKK